MSEEQDQAAAHIAATDQSKAGISDMADHLAVFFHRLLDQELDEYEALELTTTLLIESLRDDD